MSLQKEYLYYAMYILLIVYMVMILVFIICHSVFIDRIIPNDLFYDCSDYITNEVWRQENKNTKKSILWTAINLGGDVFFLVYNGLIILIFYVKEKCKYRGFNFQKSLSIKPDDISEKYGIKPKDIYNKPIREVIVENNPTPALNSDKNSKINSKENNDKNNDISNRKLDYDHPPPACAS